MLDQLASSHQRLDQALNQLLAKNIAAKKDADAISELIELVQHSSTRVKGDAIKVLYEVGEIDPLLIAPHLPVFAHLLRGNNQRLVWGAMCAIDCIAGVEPRKVHHHLPTVLKAMDGESVIARDHGVNTLVKLCT